MIPLFLLIIISHHTLPIQSYTPPDSIAIDCGSSSLLSQDFSNRPWHGDDTQHTSNANFTFVQTHNSFTFQSQKQPTIKVPYFTARLSSSPFSYIYPLAFLNPVFIRLHFYHDTYDSFHPLKAFFDLKANQFTLLSNFSPSLHSTYLKEKVFVKEFSLIPQSETLNLTFAPSDSMSDSFAFVNGIEIVSVPSGLYYGSGGTLGFNFIGYEEYSYHLTNDTALELAYRLNVGGSFISAANDTGMFREWTPDDEFVNIVGALPVNLSVNLKWSKNTANYSAPSNVYSTARSMGNNATENMGHNLTWNLPVDTGFTYWVRLHFCEFQSDITAVGDREFIIYINNRIAEEQADVIVWSQGNGNGRPLYRDYTVFVLDENNKQNLSISLSALSEYKSKYQDPILNGVEVFKLSNPSGKLAAPNPYVLLTPSSERNLPPPKKKSTTGIIAGISAGGLTVFILGLILGILFLRKRKVSTKDTVSSTLPADLCRHFSIADIRAATKDFDQVFIIGRGGFGDVYKGHIDGLDSTVAIKRLNPGSNQGAREFMTEIEILSQLRHVHLVSLIGYCNDESEMMLVYDYMSHGTLRDHLYRSDNPPLSWKQRLQICIGAAKGLHYLHSGAKRMIIHRDVKSTNILLDDNYDAKVSDFGLSKMNPDDTTNTHMSTEVKGTFGYLDPEYYRRQQLTEKSDVYSFGVVLLEVLCARPAVDKSLEEDQISLAFWARRCYENRTVNQIVDPNLTGRIAPECLRKFVDTAMSCLNDEGIQRPSMSDLVRHLEFVVQLQNSAMMEGEKIDDNEFTDENALRFYSCLDYEFESR